jgi:hypothetical protein
MFLSNNVSGTSTVSEGSPPTLLPLSDADRTAESERAVPPGTGLGEYRAPRVLDVALVTVVELIKPGDSSSGT